jgi:hypothetical protein
MHAGEEYRWIVGQVTNNNAKKGVCKLSFDVGGALFCLLLVIDQHLPLVFG